MLDGMRKAAQNWLGKLVLTVMFGFLILSFAIWGVGDIFRGFGQGKAISVGGTDISTEELRYEYQTALQQLQQSTRQPVTNQQARAMGLDQRVISRLIAAAALNNKARELHLAMSDANVSQSAFNDPEFKGPLGTFDRTVFLDKLRSAGLDEKRFAEKLRSSYLRAELTGSLVAGLKVPPSLMETVFRYANETRSVDYFVMDAKAAGEIATPSDAELTKFFEGRKGSYRAPEYRKIVTLAVTPASVLKPADIPEADIAALYEKSKAAYTTPETRQIQQIVFKSGEDKEAAEALAKIRGGAKFEEVAATRNLKPSDIDLGTVTADKLTDPAVSKAAFALKEGETSEVIKGRFGPVLVHVAKVNPASTKTLDQVKDELRTRLANERAIAEVERIHRKIEDERTSGKTLAEAAKSAGLTVRTIDAIDANSLDKAGKPVEGLVDPAALLKAVFASDIGVDNDTLTTRDRGYIWFEVAAVEPSHELKFEEVRAQVEAAWRDDTIAVKLREKAEAFVKEIDGGKSIEEIAKTAGVKLEHAGDVKRIGYDKIAPAVVDRMFSVPVGKASTGVISATQRVVFKVLDSAIPPYDPDNETVKAIKPQIENAFLEDIGLQYLANLQKEEGVQINQTVVRSVTGANEN